jgi:hypothetical protein
LVKLAPLAAVKKRRVAGRLKGKFAFSDSFFDPLPDGALEPWSGA